MNGQTLDMIQRLCNAGIDREDAWQLRRISMTLHRWHELECGDGNEWASWCITRGHKKPAAYAITHLNNPGSWWDGEFWAPESKRKIYQGRPLLSGFGETDHVLEFGKIVRVSDGEFVYNDDGKPYIEKHLHSENHARYEPIADREAGAKRRLARIMARYPALRAYVQTDPRGCALYILPPGITDDNYSRGVAVYK